MYANLIRSTVAILIFALPSAASTIPVLTATSATVFVSPGDSIVQGFATFTLGGQNFSYGGSATLGCGFCSFFDYQPGTALSVFLETFSEGFDSLTIGHHGYSPLLSGGTLDLVGGSFDLPTGDQSTFSITVLATLSGVLHPCIFDPVNVICSAPIATINVSLNGTGTLNYARNSGGTWNFVSAEFNFSSASPVPEPSTFLLLGSGVIGLMGAVRQRRRRK